MTASKKRTFLGRCLLCPIRFMFLEEIVSVYAFEQLNVGLLCSTVYTNRSILCRQNYILIHLNSLLLLNYIQIEPTFFTRVTERKRRSCVS